jgi:hypothetical protein
MSQKPSRRRDRWLALAVVAALLGSLTLSPAFGQRSSIPSWADKLFFTKDETRIKFTPRKNSRKHYKKFAKKKNVYTKGEVYSKAEVDSQFLPKAGSTTLSVHPSDWVAENLTPPSGSVRYSTTDTFLEGSAQDVEFQTPVTLTTSLQGKSVQINSFELCYDATGGGSTLDSVQMLRMTQTSSGSTTLGGEVVIADEADRDDSECRTYAGAQPVPIGPQDTVAVTARVDFATLSAMQVARLTINLSIY